MVPDCVRSTLFIQAGDPNPAQVPKAKPAPANGSETPLSPAGPSCKHWNKQEGKRGGDQTSTPGFNDRSGCLLLLELPQAVCKAPKPCELVPLGALEGKQDLPLRLKPGSDILLLQTPLRCSCCLLCLPTERGHAGETRGTTTVPSRKQLPGGCTNTGLLLPSP